MSPKAHNWQFLKNFIACFLLTLKRTSNIKKHRILCQLMIAFSCNHPQREASNYIQNTYSKIVWPFLTKLYDCVFLRSVQKFDKHPISLIQMCIWFNQVRKEPLLGGPH